MSGTRLHVALGELARRRAQELLAPVVGVFKDLPENTHLGLETIALFDTSVTRTSRISPSSGPR